MTPFLEPTGEELVNEEFDCANRGLVLGSLFFGRLMTVMARWAMSNKKFRVTIEHNPEDNGRSVVKYEFI